MIIIVKTNYLVVTAVAVAALQFLCVYSHIIPEVEQNICFGKHVFLPPVHMEYKTVIFLPYATPAERSSWSWPQYLQVNSAACKFFMTILYSSTSVGTSPAYLINHIWLIIIIILHQTRLCLAVSLLGKQDEHKKISKIVSSKKSTEQIKLLICTAAGLAVILICVSVPVCPS